MRDVMSQWHIKYEQDSHKDEQKEEAFYDSVGEKFLNEEDLIVEDITRFLAGSRDAFHYLMERMGNVRKKRILDYGCGSGWLGVYLAKLGAKVEGFDISGKFVEVASLRAEVNGVFQACNFLKMSAEKLEYPDEYFDIIAGISILHHVDLEQAIYHLHRVMKKGAVAMFIEPLGGNPVLNWTRDKVFNIHYGLKKNKSTEHPLTYCDIHTIGRIFSEYHWKEFQLLSMVRRFIGDTLTETMYLHKLDEWLLTRLPSVRRFCRLVVIGLHK